MRLLDDIVRILPSLIFIFFLSLPLKKIEIVPTQNAVKMVQSGHE